MALAFAQVKSQTVSSVSSQNIVFSSGITSGSIILVTGHLSTGTSNVTLSDPSTDTVTDSGIGFLYDNNSMQLFAKAFFSPTAATTTITATFTGSCSGRVLAYEVSGFTAGTASWDKISSVVGQGSSCDSGNTATLSQANEVAVGYGTDYGAFSGVGAGWTSDGDDNTFFDGIGGHRVLASSTALSFSATSGGFVFATALIATVKGTVSGGGTNPVSKIIQVNQSIKRASYF